jgi:hypothetical protein
MRRFLTIVTLLAFCAAQQGFSQSLFETSSQDSSQQSTDDSSQNSSQASSEGSSQWSTDNSSDSEASTEATTDGTRNSEPSAIALVTVSAVVSIAIAVGGVLLTVHVTRARQEAVLGLQDQIYAGEGKDYRELLAFFELEGRELMAANDELVASGHRIDSDQDAADYLAALALALTKKSEKVLSML